MLPFRPTAVLGPQNAFALFTWPAPGIYQVSLTVEDEDGRSHTGTRQVIVYPSRSQAYDGVIGISGLSGGIDQGGWSCSMQVRGDLSFLLKARELQGYLPVVTYADTTFETSYGVWERKTIGPNWQAEPVYDLRDDPRIIFSGYVDGASIAIDVNGSTATFSCRIADMLLENMQTNTYGFFEDPYDGTGITFVDLQTHDVIRHMVQEHSNWMDWHDSRLFYTIYDTANGLRVPFLSTTRLASRTCGKTYQPAGAAARSTSKKSRSARVSR
jgi:hypothetical protein